jgi:diadenosine tetraphosphate (Ap4A) HIT family hydrolase
MDECPLCLARDEVLVHGADDLRVILIDDPDYPGYCRVIWNAHVAEMSELPRRQARRLMDAVFAVETALRTVMQPTKVNLASLGNMAAHLHWHVIPRFADDAHFPQSIWGPRMRATDARRVAGRLALLPELRKAIGVALTHAV